MSDVRILVVDPQTDTRQVTAETLRSGLVDVGSTVETAEGISQARSMLRDGHVDCVVTESDLPDGMGFDLVEMVRSGPGDLTGMGIKLSMTYQRFHGEGITRVRTGILSVSTLLMYTDVRTVFRFLHTLSGRISAIGGLGIFFIDPQSHDTKSTNMLTQVSDGRIDVREVTGDAEDGELRVRGLPDQPRDWQPFSLGQEVDQ